MTEMSARQWQHFAHEADIGVRGFGDSKEEAFEQAALELTAVVTDPETVYAAEIVSVNCEAPGAYKDVKAVVDAADQAGLSKKVAKLVPMICVKG
jgi:SHS2 domain-containing protein